MKKHSYKLIQYKCQECDFLGTNSVTMDVHHGKEHGDNFECGMCEFIAPDKVALETHLFTCKMFVCNSCDQKCKTLADLKTHMKNIHDKEYKYVKHSKQDRTNKEEFTEKNYKTSELFSELKQKLWRIETKFQLTNQIGLNSLKQNINKSI